MCWLCDEFGDPEYGNGLWYLNPKNHARNMYKLRAPSETARGAEAGLETGERRGPTLPDLINAMEQGNEEEFVSIQSYMIEHGQGSQVVPLEESNKILELSSPLAIMSCICRKGTRAIDERNELEYTCLGMGVGMLKWERWPERYKGGVKFVSVEEAIEWNNRMDKKGFVHILMLFGAPFIGGFCQCDYPDCYSIRNAVDFGIGALKSHYVAEIDYDICNGCGICAQRCQYGALKFEVTTKVANIDQFACYGCGLCQTGCPRGAINLPQRSSLPALAEVWR